MSNLRDQWLNDPVTDIQLIASLMHPIGVLLTMPEYAEWRETIWGRTWVNMAEVTYQKAMRRLEQVAREGE